MQVITQTIDGLYISRMLPEILVLVVAFVAILADVVLPKGKSTRGVQLVTFIGLVVVLAATYWQRNNLGGAFIASGTNKAMVIVDGFTTYFRAILVFITMLIVSVSEGYLIRNRIRIAEYYLMLIFALFGMLLMTMANDLLILFLGIETMSVSLYALVGMPRHKISSTEGAMKYFLLGSFTTGFLVFGIALLYGAMAITKGIEPSMNIHDIMVFFNKVHDMPMLAYAGMGLILVAFAFKIALVPFHWWSPDAYEGAPTSVTAFMSTAPKAAAFGAFIRIFYTAFANGVSDWGPVLWWIAVLTMTFGNLLALRQTSIKRMLAFSSITHAGYLVMALLCFQPHMKGAFQVSVAAILFYLVSYAVMNIGAFLVAIAINKNEGEDKGYQLDDYKGLVYRNPVLAISMFILMISLAGIPPTAGFFGKYYIFSSVVKAGYISLAIIGVLNSAVSVFYYLRPVIMMFMKDRDEENESEIHWSVDMGTVIIICVLLVLLIGVMPSLILEPAQAAAAALALY